MENSLAVIIPNHNNCAYIEQCVESVVSQSYKPNEIIIFDDASTDQSKSILEQLESRYGNVKVIYSQKNVGVSAARHRAILATESDYITVLDSDDYYSNRDKLKKEMQTVQREREKGKKNVCAFSQTVRVTESGQNISNGKIRKLGYMTRFRLVTRLYHNYIPRDFCFLKSSYIEAGGYKISVCLYEDWDLCLRLLKNCRFVFSGGFGTAYRQKADGLSKVSNYTNFHTKRLIFNENRDVIRYTLLEKVFFYIILFFSYIKTLIIEKYRLNHNI